MYRALLVCNSIYPSDPAGLPDLLGAQVDGLHLWRQLTDPTTGMFAEEAVTVLWERSQREVFEAIERFFKGARSGDTVLLYFSGHGLSAGGSLYLCLRDTISTRVRSTGISTDEIGKIINDSFAESIVILLDCCHSGGFKGSAAASLTGTGRYVISATTAVELANDSSEPGAPSPFTQALLESLQWGADDRNHDGLVDIDDVFLDLEARLSEEFPRPERDFDGAGRVTIAKRVRTGAAKIDEAVSEPPIRSSDSRFVEPLFRLQGLPFPRRRMGDFSVADMHGSVTSIAISLALVVSAMFAFRFAYVVVPDENNSSDYLAEQVGAAAAAILGIIHLILGTFERLYLEKPLRRRPSRRSFIIQYDKRSSVIFRRVQTIFVIPVLVLCLGPLSTRGFVTPSWVITWTLLALLVWVRFARWSRLGDATFVASAILMVLGNCIPFEFDPGPERQTGFYTGLDSSSGLIIFGVGLVMVGAWWLRLSPPFLCSLAVLALLPSIASAADAFRGYNPHWFLGLTSLLVSGVGLASGAGRLLPLQGAPTARSVRNAKRNGGSQDAI